MSDLFELPVNSVMNVQEQQVALFDQIDKIIEQAILTSSPQSAINYGNTLVGTLQLRGLALAKFLWRFRAAWENEFLSAQIADEPFENMIEAQMGIKPQTTRKWTDLWMYIFENPELPNALKYRLLTKPVKTLNLLTAGARDGDFDLLDWSDIADAATEGEVRDIVRSKRGEVTSSGSALQITMSPLGTIKAYMNGESVLVGSLNVEDARPGDILERAIARIVKGAGINWK